MTLTKTRFRDNLQDNQPPQGITVVLQALWYDAKGDWDKAHELVQDLPGPTAAWIHGYLHRKEGDNWNANYWYAKAGHTMPAATLAEEWESLVTAMLNDQ